MPDNTIRPAQPEEKLYLRMQQAREFGKEFNETVERGVLGLPPVEDREPIFIKAATQRERMTDREDIAGARELEAEAKRAGAEDIQKQSALKDARIAELERQIASLRGEGASSNGPAPVPAPSAKTGEDGIPEGQPDDGWSKNAIIDWLAREGMEVPERKGMLMSKTAVLEFALAEIAKRDAHGIANETGSSDAAG